MSIERRITHSFESQAGAASLLEATFVPQRYEPNYAYPLLVLFHARGGDEQQMVRSMPALSWRNYVGLGLRGPEPVARRSHEEGYGWGADFTRPDRPAARALAASASAETSAAAFRRRLLGGPPDPVEVVENGVFAAVLQARRTLHVHSERIFLVGSGEGASVAYRLGLSYPERFAGVVALNGWIPAGFRPLGRLKACRDLRILVVHGEWNAKAPIEHARREVATLRAGGLRVAFQSYPCGHRLTTRMLADVDTWIINQCTDEC
jgi:phospholipase/carboxylesterase